MESKIGSLEKMDCFKHVLAKGVNPCDIQGNFTRAAVFSLSCVLIDCRL